MTLIWKLLRTDPSNDRIPQLLARYKFGKSNYTVLVTDLTNIWTESLEQRPLIERAWSVDSPIDPVDSEQRERLLSHIQDALDGKTQIEIHSSTANTIQSLHLTAHIPLPKPLKPLLWPFNLILMPQSTLTNEFLLPCIGQQVNATHEVASLLQCLRDKDFVISKLLEKLEAEGIDMTNVFPNAAALKSGRKPKSKEDVGRVVQGLGQFSEKLWRDQIAKSHQISNDRNGVLAQAFALFNQISLRGIQDTPDFGSWWQHVGSSSLQKNEGVLNSETSISPPASLSTPTDNGIQNQLTPEHQINQVTEESLSAESLSLPSRTRLEKEAVQNLETDDSTTDDSHEDGDQHSMQLEAPTKTQNLPIESESESCSEGPPGKSRLVSKAFSSNPKAKLGKIGGNLKHNVASRPPKVGYVEGVSKVDDEQEMSHHGALRLPEPSGTSAPQISPKHREDSVERANKKREQLKRDLEAQSKGAVKKKRRF